MSQLKCIECDYCGKWQMSLSKTYKKFRNILKKNLGWISIKIKNHIYDFCSQKCFELWRKERH